MELDNVLWIILGVVVAVVVTVSVLNLTSGEKKIEHDIDHDYDTRDPQFLRAMGQLLPPPIVPGNRIDTLINGDQIFPAMLEAIRGARQTICFETYIYWSGEIGRQFANAFAERARAGVKVHVLLDWLGSKAMEDDYLEEMEQAGVQVERYHPLHWYSLSRINQRTHRKLLIVDGRVGFTGGVGIADEWSGNGQDPEHWRDTHFQIEGPCVAQLQAAFMDNWMKTHARVLHTSDYFPELTEAGQCRAQVFQSSPREGSDSVRLMFLLSLACAKSSVLIASSYFVPDDLSVCALVGAQKRGAKVQIIVPGGHIDMKIVRRASRSRWGPLLEAGIAIYEYQPTMYHCKVMVVDGIWTSVGSTNLDNRSFRLNDEANLNVYDEEFAQRQTELFEQDKARSRQITYEEWTHRPWQEKLTERLAGLLREQL